MAEVAAESDDTSNVLHSALDKFLGDMHGMAFFHKNMNGTSEGNGLVANMGEGCIDHRIQICSPSHVTCKG